MKTSLVALALLLLVLPLMSVEAITYDDALKISIYPLTNLTYVCSSGSCSTTESQITFRVVFNSTEDDRNDMTFDVTYNVTDVAGRDFQWLSPNIEYLSPIDTTATNLDYFKEWNVTNNKLTTCLIQRGQFETALNACNGKLLNYEGVNATQCKTNLDTCTLSLQQKDLVIESKDNEISDVKTKSDDSKNTKWFFGVIGLVVGAVGFNWYKNSKGGGTPRERSMGEFNKNQAG